MNYVKEMTGNISWTKISKTNYGS